MSESPTTSTYTTFGVAAFNPKPQRVITQKTLTSGEVAIMLGYLHGPRSKHAGQPDRSKVYRLAREGIIPPAIHADRLPCIDWRWAPAAVDAFINGAWPPVAAPATKTRRAS